MQYSTRTITWRFQDSPEIIPELTNKAHLSIRLPSDLYNNYNSLFKDQVKERFIVFWLSSSNEVIGFEIVSEGTLNSCLVHPREVFRGAIIATCTSIILAHNHPSHNPEPSNEDLTITKQLIESGKILGISVHDHIIFAGKTYTSFAERGLM